MRPDPRRALDDAGRQPVPAPRPGFVAGLEDRLLADARSGRPEPGPSTSRSRPSFGAIRSALPGSLAIALVIAVVVGVISFTDRTPGPYELTDAVNVEVALADGTTLVDPDGLVLPDDATVTIGHGGSARIGGVTLAAGDVATVHGPDLRIDRSGRPGVAEATGSNASPSPRPTAPPGTPTPAPTGSKAPPPTARATATDRPPTPTPAGAPTKTASPTAPGDRATPSPRASTKPPATTRTTDVKPLKLAARRAGPSAIAAMWSGTPDARRYVLVATSSRTGAAGAPTYPGSAVIGTFTHPPKEALIFRVPQDVVEVRLLVVALDGQDRILARSPIERVLLPR